MNGKERIEQTIRGGKTDHYAFMPITMMFAADLIGKPYGEYAADYRVLTEGQSAFAERFRPDYVSVISDPAREAADCGAEIIYYPDQPPAVNEAQALLSDKGRLSELTPPEPGSGKRMSDRLRAVAALKERWGSTLMIEGWVEGPCAEAADLRGINTLMTDFFDDPAFIEDLFDFIVEMELAFARAQIAEGAGIIGIGDAAASLIGRQFYEDYVLPREQRLVNGIREAGALSRLHICGNTSALTAGMASLGCDIVDLDYPVDMAEARKVMGPEQVLLGNIHPIDVLKNGSPDAVRSALEQCRAAAAPRYIVGAGCEVPRGTPHENLDAMAAFARE